MGKAYVSGMEHEALPFFSFTIQSVAYYRYTKPFGAGRGDSELVGAAG